MTVRLGKVSDIARVEVKCSRGIRRLEQRCPPLAADEEAPFVTGRVPVDFTHRTGFHGDYGCSEVVCYREGLRVNDLDAAAGNVVRWLL